jgi:hypothetical protein
MNFEHLLARIRLGEDSDPWQAVNVSSHYRKCGLAHDADALMQAIDKMTDFTISQAVTRRGATKNGQSRVICEPLRSLAAINGTNRCDGLPETRVR